MLSRKVIQINYLLTDNSGDNLKNITWEKDTFLKKYTIDV